MGDVHWLGYMGVRGDTCLGVARGTWGDAGYVGMVSGPWCGGGYVGGGGAVRGGGRREYVGVPGAG